MKSAEEYHQLLTKALDGEASRIEDDDLVSRLLTAQKGYVGNSPMLEDYLKGKNDINFKDDLENIKQGKLPKGLNSSDIPKDSDTYKIFEDLQTKFFETTDIGKRFDYLMIANQARTLLSANTPILYAQNKIIDELHKNAKIAEDFQRQLSKDIHATLKYSRLSLAEYNKEFSQRFFLESSIYLAYMGYSKTDWNYKYIEGWRVPEHYFSTENPIFNGYNMINDPNSRNWRSYMYFDGMIISADYFGNLNLAYIGAKMGLTEWVYKNFSTMDTKLDIEALDYGTKMAKQGR
jgi:hypothetical protein